MYAIRSDGERNIVFLVFDFSVYFIERELKLACNHDEFYLLKKKCVHESY